MPAFVQLPSLCHRPFIPHAYFHRAVKKAAQQAGLVVVWRKPVFYENRDQLRQACRSLLPYDIDLHSNMFLSMFVYEHINCMVEGFLEFLVEERAGVIVQPFIGQDEFWYYLW